MKGYNPLRSILLLLCLTVALGGCSHTSSRTRPATFDGDVRLAGAAKDFYSRHRVLTLNGHDLYDGRRPDVRDQKIDCLLRDCKLQPGQHTIDVVYRWSSLEAEKKKRKSTNWQAFGFILGMLGGAGGDVPVSSRYYYPCRVSISFEVQSAHDYRLNVVHTDQTENPEEFQIVETATSAVVGSSNPSC